MEVDRGRAGSSAALLDRVGTTGEPRARVWCPARHVSFGPRDVRAPGYAEASDAANSHGYAIRERSMGGHPVAFTGETIAFVLAGAPDDASIGDRYERIADVIAAALRDLGIEVEHCSPPRTFCPGTYGLSANGKVVGLAQRIRANVVAVGGIVLVANHEEVASVLAPVYRHLDLPFEPETVGSIAKAGGPDDPDIVIGALETAFTAASTDRTL